ncbi:hypothetical protein AL346_23255 (plasmid) [Chelatococcus sp. CO-6]|uniref:malto-oligosyltrehalose synthase n=2 Tax=unclassified Chelatococcus TaxID=2638111 RepID=UPI00069F067C|nr:malto-oligosyltrehalose synthase [Chelatococcus sp. CO-6]ALA20598.1 hypothetical protein AL346_23255 [Chelatococcus sp. CO-6]
MTARRVAGLDARLAKVADAVGIAPRHVDGFGRLRRPSIATRRAILAAFGLDADSLEVMEAQKRLSLPPYFVARAKEPSHLPWQGPSQPGRRRVRITDEGGAAIDRTVDVVVTEAGAALALPPLGAGYYRLQLADAPEDAATWLLVAPPRCWQPEALERGERLWGITAQVYGLRSPPGEDIGDLSDIGDVAARAADLGAAFVGLSPLHALFPSDRSKISPYSPSSRLFLDPLYIDPAAVDGRTPPAPGAGPSADSLLVDYEAAWRHRSAVLESLWRERRGGDDPAFAQFVEKRGQPLTLHAIFEALSEHFRDQGCRWSGDWPAPFRDCHAREVRDFAAAQAERVRFHAWLQYEADRQLAAAAERARAMPVGLYRDLAVGPDGAGSEVWAQPAAFAQGLTTGAPPDLLGPQGQNWGLPPPNPLTMAMDGFAAFRALVAANLRHAGAIRIDHAFQLQRLFVIPAGATAADGAYVTYPFDALLAVLRIESHRARCLVIAEDLGTAPEGFSDAIIASGLLSYRLLPFERTGDGGFRSPRNYPSSALAAMSTHDLPTFRGWWAAADVDARERLGIFSRRRAQDERRRRARDRAALAAALAEEGLAPPEPSQAPPLEAATRFLARTASALVAVQLEDMAGEMDQANLPGTVDEYPNWRRRLSMTNEALFAAGGTLARTAAAIAEEGRSPAAVPRRSAVPRATYRLQFNRDFTFDGAGAIVPYLSELGISHAYASPIHQARAGSTHGYDIVDHAAVSAELGGEEGLRRLGGALAKHGLGLILDIVPNHMGIGGADNRDWLSVLEWGPRSPAAQAFDIDWRRPGADGKLVVASLGSPYGEALDKGELKLAFEAAEGCFSVWYWEHRFPLSPPTYPMILDPVLGGHPALAAAVDTLRSLAATDGTHALELAQEVKADIAAIARDAKVAAAIAARVEAVNGEPACLHRLLEAQHFRLVHWRVGADAINYRRFFDIGDLAGLRVEEPAVFERTHALIARLVRDGVVAGLRIDHIDGLADPAGYLAALRRKVGPEVYIVAEKILEPGEELRRWPIAGTTGYDVLGLLDGVFVDSARERSMDGIYRRAAGIAGDVEEDLRTVKAMILDTLFAGERDALAARLKDVADADRHTRDFSLNTLRRALTEIVAALPVYRTYLDGQAVSPEDRRIIAATVAAAKGRTRLPDGSAHDFIAARLLAGGAETEADLRTRFQQLTGPVMAKSLEDTLFYRWVRLVPLNEVGSDPGRFGVPRQAFHGAMATRAADWPHALTATATHDTKRGEDTRLRIAALSEMPAQWSRAWQRWRRVVRPLLTEIDDRPAPDANDQYLLLQTILGAWPIAMLDDAGAADCTDFLARLQAYAEKALREAKRHSSWLNVNTGYEAAAKQLLAGLIVPGSPFLDAFAPLARRLARLGAAASLSRTVLKCTVPGVPDIYQGCEFWDLSLVDPDNRRAVDYAARRAALDVAARAGPADLLRDWRSGAVKQALLARLLQLRAAHPALFAQGDYRPLAVSGARERHGLAFMRGAEGARLVVVVGRLFAALLDEDEGLLPPAEIWHDTAVDLPPGTWTDVLTGRRAQRGALRELFARLPVAVLLETRDGG